MDEVIACHLCDHDLSDASHVHDQARTGPLVTVACSRCGLVQTYPHPTRAEVSDYYASGAYRREFPPLPVFELTEALEPTGRLVQPEDPGYSTALDRAAEHTARRLVREYQLEKTDRILEVGCGDGRVAAALTALGHDVCAVDADSKKLAEAMSRGVKVCIFGGCGTPPTSVSYGTDNADFVYALQVVEHFADPIGELADLVRCAKVGGVVAVEVPNVDRPYVSLTHFLQKPHVVNYSPTTLRAALELAGLGSVQIREEASVLIGAGIRSSSMDAVSSSEPLPGGFLSADEYRAKRDLPSLRDEVIARHQFTPGAEVAARLKRWEADRVAKAAPVDVVERFIDGHHLDPADLDRVRDELRRWLTVGSEAIVGIQKLVTMIENRDIDPWHADTWVRGFLSGGVHESARLTHVLGLLVNEWMLTLNRGVRVWATPSAAQHYRARLNRCALVGSWEGVSEKVAEARRSGLHVLVATHDTEAPGWQDARDAAHGWAVVVDGVLVKKGGQW